jgi:hypothetical protein
MIIGIDLYISPTSIDATVHVLADKLSSPNSGLSESTFDRMCEREGSCYKRMLNFT